MRGLHLAAALLALWTCALPKVLAQNQTSLEPYLGTAIGDSSACLQAFLPQIARGCGETNKGQGNETLLAALDQLVSICVDSGSQLVHMLVPALGVLRVMPQAVAQLDAQLTTQQPQAAVNFVNISFLDWGYSLNDFAASDNTTYFHGGWDLEGAMLDPIALGALGAARKLIDLTQLVISDATLKWSNMINFYRNAAITEGGRITAIPLGGLMLQLYYRSDVLSAKGIRVPNTWSELVMAAAAANGTDMDSDGKPDAGICLHMAPGCFGGFYLAAIWASYIQSMGTNTGTYFNPLTMEALANNAAMAAAAQMLLGLMQYSHPQDINSCSPIHNAFLQGQCAFLIGLSGQFKVNSLSPASKVRRSARVALLPGSTQVLDRATGNLVNCTASICPYATEEQVQFQSPDGGPPVAAVALVSRAPFFPLGSIAAGIFVRTPQSMQRRLFSLYAYMAGPIFSWELVLNPASELGPFRNEHFDPANIGRWVAQGYDAQAAQEYLAVVRSAQEHPNNLLELRTPNAVAYRTALGQVYRDILSGGASTIPSSIAALDARLKEEYNSSSEGFSKVADTYRFTIGWQAPPPPQPPPSAPPPYQPDVGSNSDHSDWKVAVQVAVPVGIFVLVAGIVLLMYRSLGMQLAGDSTAQKQLKGKSWAAWLMRCLFKGAVLGPVQPPGKGSGTTLVVTDVQESTQLWEAIEADIMDVVWNLHHGCMRKCSTKHSGYESQTEGDSFILAFANTEAAVSFCLDTQRALLDLDWPPELLEHPLCMPVYVKPAEGQAGQGGRALQGNKPNATLSMGADTFLPTELSGARRTRGSVHFTMDHIPRGGHVWGGRRGLAMGTRNAYSLTAGTGRTLWDAALPMPGAAACDPMSGMSVASLWSGNPPAGVAPLGQFATVFASLPGPVPASSTQPSTPKWWHRRSAGTQGIALAGGGGRKSGMVSSLTAGRSSDLEDGHLVVSGRQMSATSHVSPRNASFSTTTRPTHPPTMLPAVALAQGVAGPPSTAYMCDARDTHLRPRGSAADLSGPDESHASAQSSGAHQPPAQSSHDGIPSSGRQHSFSTAAHDEAATGSYDPSLGMSVHLPSIPHYSGIPNRYPAPMLPLPQLHLHASQDLPVLREPLGGTPHAIANSSAEGPLSELVSCNESFAAAGLDPSLFRSNKSVSMPWSPLMSYEARGTGGQGLGTRAGSGPGPAMMGTQALTTLGAGAQGTTFGQGLAAAWQTCAASAPGAQLIWRGLRVRMGAASGLKHDTDMVYSEVAARTKYTGEILDAAKGISNAANGGQVVFAEATHAVLDLEALASKKHGVFIIHMGEYELRGAVQGRPPLVMYMAHAKELLARVTKQRPLRARLLSLSTLEAPTYTCAHATVAVVARGLLQAEGGPVADEVMAVAAAVAREVALTHKGYIVQNAEGLATATFTSAYAAISWALAVQQRLTQHTWSDIVLRHEQCEPVEIPLAPNSPPGATPRIAFAGPRLKGAVVFGPLRWSYSSISGRLTYEGRLLQQSRNLLRLALTGMVVASPPAGHAALAASMVDEHEALTASVHPAASLPEEGSASDRGSPADAAGVDMAAVARAAMHAHVKSTPGRSSSIKQQTDGSEMSMPTKHSLSLSPDGLQNAAAELQAVTGARPVAPDTPLLHTATPAAQGMGRSTFSMRMAGHISNEVPAGEILYVPGHAYAQSHPYTRSVNGMGSGGHGASLAGTSSNHITTYSSSAAQHHFELSGDTGGLLPLPPGNLPTRPSQQSIPTPFSRQSRPSNFSGDSGNGPHPNAARQQPRPVTTTSMDPADDGGHAHADVSHGAHPSSVDAQLLLAWQQARAHGGVAGTSHMADGGAPAHSSAQGADVGVYKPLRESLSQPVNSLLGLPGTLYPRASADQPGLAPTSQGHVRHAPAPALQPVSSFKISCVSGAQAGAIAAAIASGTPRASTPATGTAPAALQPVALPGASGPALRNQHIVLVPITLRARGSNSFGSGSGDDVYLCSLVDHDNLCSEWFLDERAGAGRHDSEPVRTWRKSFFQPRPSNVTTAVASPASQSAAATSVNPTVQGPSARSTPQLPPQVVALGKPPVLLRPSGSAHAATKERTTSGRISAAMASAVQTASSWAGSFQAPASVTRTTSTNNTRANSAAQAPPIAEAFGSLPDVSSNTACVVSPERVGGISHNSYPGFVLGSRTGTAGPGAAMLPPPHPLLAVAGQDGSGSMTGGTTSAMSFMRLSAQMVTQRALNGGGGGYDGGDSLNSSHLFATGRTGDLLDETIPEESRFPIMDTGSSHLGRTVDLLDAGEHAVAVALPLEGSTRPPKDANSQEADHSHSLRSSAALPAPHPSSQHMAVVPHAAVQHAALQHGKPAGFASRMTAVVRSRIAHALSRRSAPEEIDGDADGETEGVPRHSGGQRTTSASRLPRARRMSASLLVSQLRQSAVSMSSVLPGRHANSTRALPGSASQRHISFSVAPGTPFRTPFLPLPAPTAAGETASTSHGGPLQRAAGGSGSFFLAPLSRLNPVFSAGITHGLHLPGSVGHHTARMPQQQILMQAVTPLEPGPFLAQRDSVRRSSVPSSPPISHRNSSAHTPGEGPGSDDSLCPAASPARSTRPHPQTHAAHTVGASPLSQARPSAGEMDMSGHAQQYSLSTHVSHEASSSGDGRSRPQPLTRAKPAAGSDGDSRRALAQEVGPVASVTFAFGTSGGEVEISPDSMPPAVIPPPQPLHHLAPNIVSLGALLNSGRH